MNGLAVHSQTSPVPSSWPQVAAFSHSISVGRRASCARAKAAASNQETWTTGASRSPASAAAWWVMSYSSFHAQPSSRPPLAALVAAALGERQPGGVGDRRAADREPRGRRACGAGARCRRRSPPARLPISTGPSATSTISSPVPATARGPVNDGGRTPPSAHRLQHRLGVLELVPDHELVQLASTGASSARSRTASMYSAQLGAAQELEVAADRARRLERVVERGQILAQKWAPRQLGG